MATKIVVVTHPESLDKKFEPKEKSLKALISKLEMLISDTSGSRQLLATTEGNIQAFVNRISTHFGIDITECDCLMGNGDFDCVDDCIVQEGFLIVIAARDVALALASFLEAVVGRKSASVNDKTIRPLGLITI